MENGHHFLVNQSILYRNTQKYFDKILSKFDIGAGQLIYIIAINENEGVTMQEVSRLLEMDKGTTTKSIQRLIEQGYVEMRIDEKDRRIKHLHMTEKSGQMINEIYGYRNDYRMTLAKDMDFETFAEALEQVTDNSRRLLVDEDRYQGIRIGRLDKLSFADYPGKAAAVVYMGGCNFKCPYCRYRDLVFMPENYATVSPKEVLGFLEKRKGLLDAVCISGGEPLLQEGLAEFMDEIKDLGYEIKLDTNGYDPEKLQTLLETGLVDCAALDVKNTALRYAETIGMQANAFRYDNIVRSIAILQQSGITYELKTTVVREYHTLEQLKELAECLKDKGHWVLQQFIPGDSNILPGLTAYTPEEMKEMYAVVRQIKPDTELRGIDE
ncbi:MAG: anaerobic ribonucleoside-triphosphate reductase activating protein [Solobacterium sp.]|nr:anaerobic ribonucleoside-triphosphate reductase activating protein [Solobacterium sp.]